MWTETQAMRAFVMAGLADDAHTPPQGVQSNARRALELMRGGHAGSGMTDVGRARARQLASGRPVGVATIRQMNAYFARHGASGQQEDHSGTSPAAVAWLAWGGDAGKAWAHGVLAKLGELAAGTAAFRKGGGIGFDPSQPRDARGRWIHVGDSVDLPGGKTAEVVGKGADGKVKVDIGGGQVREIAGKLVTKRDGEGGSKGSTPDAPEGDAPAGGKAEESAAPSGPRTGTLGDAVARAKETGSPSYVRRSGDGQVTIHDELPADRSPGLFHVTEDGKVGRVGAKGAVKPVPAKDRPMLDRFLGGLEESVPEDDLPETRHERPDLDLRRTPAQQREQVRRAQEAIANVHSTEGWGRLRVASTGGHTTNAGKADGFFQPKTDGQGEVFLAVNPDSRSAGNTMVHELGHALDYTVLTGDGETSLFESPPRNALGAAAIQFNGATKRSAAVQKAGRNAPSTPGPYGQPSPAEYWTSPRENWARAYAQFIAEKSGDKALTDEVASLQRRGAGDKAIPMVWSGEDWPPVRDAVQRVLEAKGLM